MLPYYGEVIEVGNGSSGRKKKSSATPSSGVTYDQFLKMSSDEQVDLIEKIIDDDNIKVPDYLDNSQTSKVMYALGMNNKPEMVSDKELNKLKGRAIYRTVNNSKNISAKDIIDQIKTGDYTQLSDVSAYGRALYFANSFTNSASYGYPNQSVMMRAKIKPNAKIENEGNMWALIAKDKAFKNITKIKNDDKIALYAISKGIDGWYDSGSGYMMIINRGSLVTSPQNKTSLYKFRGWASAPDA